MRKSFLVSGILVLLLVSQGVLISGRSLAAEEVFGKVKDIKTGLGAVQTGSQWNMVDFRPFYIVHLEEYPKKAFIFTDEDAVDFGWAKLDKNKKIKYKINAEDVIGKKVRINAIKKPNKNKNELDSYRIVTIKIINK
jgi:hypothetical protein